MISNRAIIQTKLADEKVAITKLLLSADRKRAADILLQLHYQLSRTTSSITIK